MKTRFSLPAFAVLGLLVSAITSCHSWNASLGSPERPTRVQPEGRGQPHGPDERSGEVLRHRGRVPERRPGSFPDREEAWTRCRRTPEGREVRRGHRRDDAGCNPELRIAADVRATVELYARLAHGGRAAA